MKKFLNILVATFLFLSGCSTSASPEDCDIAYDEIFYLYQTDQIYDEYFFSVRDFIEENC